MIEKNRLMPFFEQVGIDRTDIIFIKELIYGELNGSIDNEVRTSLNFIQSRILFFLRLDLAI